MQYREEFVISARQEFLSRLKADIEQTEEHLQERAGDILQVGTIKAHVDFAERVRETAGPLRVAVRTNKSPACPHNTPRS